MSVVDLNGDKRPDAVVANRGAPSAVCLNDGTGGLSACRELPTESATTIVAGDLDNDGSMDLAVPHRDGGQSVVFWGDGSGAFAVQTPFGLEHINARAVAVGDSNSDGLLDIVVGDEQRGVFVIQNSGNRHFSEPLRIFSPDRIPYSIALGDLNRDDTLDIVVGYRLAIGSIFFNIGGGRSYHETSWNDGAGAVYGLALGDLNGDRWPDVAAARSGAPNGVWFSDVAK